MWVDYISNSQKYLVLRLLVQKNISHFKTSKTKKHLHKMHQDVKKFNFEESYRLITCWLLHFDNLGDFYQTAIFL